MGYKSKAQVGLLIRVMNEGWKNLIDGSKYQLPSQSLSPAVISANQNTGPLPYRSIISQSAEKGLTFFALGKKQIKKIEQIDWQFKVLHISRCFFNKHSKDEEIILKLQDIARKNACDLHVVGGDQFLIDNHDLITRICHAARKVFPLRRINLHAIDTPIGHNVSIKFNIDGTFDIFRLPVLKPSLRNSQDELRYSYPSYFDPSKMISEDQWAITLIEHSDLVVEGINEEGDRFRKVFTFSTNYGIWHDKNWLVKGVHCYYNYVKAGGLQVRNLKVNEQIHFTSKSETWIEKREYVIHLLDQAKGVKPSPVIPSKVSSESGNVFEDLDDENVNGLLEHAMFSFEISEPTHLSSFSLFCRKSLITQEVEFFKVQNKELQEIYEKNETLFFDLVDQSPNYDISQLRDDEFNPFTGDYFIDAPWEMNCSTSRQSLLFTKRKDDKQAIAFEQEMLKAGLKNFWLFS